MKAIVIILLTLMTMALGAETRGYLKIDGKSEVVAGDIIEAKFELFPASEEYLSQLGSLVGSRLLDNFYFYKLEKVYSSPNNHEYLIAEVKLIPLVSNPRGFALFQVGDRNIPVEIKFEIKDVELKEGQAFHAWKIENRFNAVIKFLVKNKIAFLLCLILAGFCMLMLFLKIQRNKKEVESKIITNWKKRNTREELEELYFIVKNSNYESLEDPPPKEILGLIESNMYRKEWPSEAFEKIDFLKGGE